MCVYCVTGDEFFRDQRPPIWPWPAPPPYVPMPATPPPPDYHGWPIEQLKELLDVLERIKKLEDKMSCPCVASKADYLGILKKRIEELEKKIV
jgi:hypothetical protein